MVKLDNKVNNAVSVRPKKKKNNKNNKAKARPALYVLVRTYQKYSDLFAGLDAEGFDFWVNAKFKNSNGYMSSDCKSASCNGEVEHLDGTDFVSSNYMDLDLHDDKKCIEIKANDDIRSSDCDKDGGEKLVCLLDCCKYKVPQFIRA
jgi:hypothetical protein